MGLYQQAVTLGREWMVTVLLFAAGAGEEWLKKETRNEAENSLSVQRDAERSLKPSLFVMIRRNPGSWTGSVVMFPGRR